MKILVLGSRGMLGSMVELYFKKFHEVTSFNKKITQENLESSLIEIQKVEADVVINCIGLIKQKSNSFEDLLFINAILPYRVTQKISQSSLFIQPSTDCVFHGDSKGHYEVDALRNATDFYGISKIYGELSMLQFSNTLILRGSIIGVSPSQGRGLLDWFLNQENNSEINGYLNHSWNGISTLEWCKLLEYLLTTGNYKNTNLIQFGLPVSVSKFELLQLFNDVFKKNIKIHPVNDVVEVNRALKSSPGIKYSSYPSQLKDLKNFLAM